MSDPINTDRLQEKLDDLLGILQQGRGDHYAEVKEWQKQVRSNVILKNLQDHEGMKMLRAALRDRVKSQLLRILDRQLFFENPTAWLRQAAQCWWDIDGLLTFLEVMGDPAGMLNAFDALVDEQLEDLNSKGFTPEPKK
ncbi:MAG: hypothetical protein PHI63_06730 [Patescibacteria group bacterium]|nr:hypothetical protein [Patescibacteria group bacterium]